MAFKMTHTVPDLYFEYTFADDFRDAAKRELFVSVLPLARAARVRAPRNPELAALRAAAEAAFRRACNKAGEPYAALQIAYSESGEPYIKGRPDLGISFSHSGEIGCALLVKTPDKTPVRCGVDVEQIKPEQTRRLSLADRFFPEELTAEYGKAPPEKRAEVFYRLWTRMEATVKMTGEGIGGCRTARIPEEANRREWQLLDNGGNRYAACAVWEYLPPVD